MGDGGHHAKGGVKLPDSLRYSPPQLAKYKASVDPYDHPKSHHEKDHGYNNNNHNGNNNNYYHDNVSNGHIPIAHPAAGQHHRRDGSPPIHHPGAPHKRDTPPYEHHRSSTKLSNGPNHHHRSSITTPPPRGPNDHHKNGSQHPRAYDDYEVERRRQHMDRPRDTKDYLIGGVHGPHPKNKSHNDAQQHHNNNYDYDHIRESQAHWNNKGQPPSHAANRAQVPRIKDTVRKPYRSRSYPREDKSHLKNDNRKHHYVDGHRGDPRSHSMMDLKGHPQPPPRSQHQSRAGGGHNYLINEDDDDYVYDPHEKPKYGPRKPAIKPINSEFNDPNKARVVMFFKNGDPYFPGIKVSFKAKDFTSFEALCSHLTPRTDLPNGVRYIFNMDGEKLKGLDEFEEGGSYICSSKKKFVPLPYSPGKPGWNPHSKFKMQEDLKLFRPPSPGAVAAGNSLDGQQGSKGKRFIRVINNDHQKLQIRHMLNSRTTQPWENLIQGMAETLRMPKGRKLFSYTGRQIQSYSQLRNELRDSDIFYLCSGDSFGPTIPRHAETSRSLDETTMDRDGHPKGHRKSNRPGSAPDWNR